MSYEKHTWETGETITADKLNNLENGVASSGSGSGIFEIVATGDEDSKTLDKTWKEIVDAFDSGRICYILDNTESGITMTYLVYGHTYNSLISEDQYLLTTGDGVYTASGQNEYPNI